MPRNRLVRNMARLNGCTDVIRGSVLVMKEGHDGLIDMTHDDIVCSNFLINRATTLSILLIYQKRPTKDDGALSFKHIQQFHQCYGHYVLGFVDIRWRENQILLVAFTWIAGYKDGGYK
ncbi:hypothetical protein BD769DRAFT_1386687 [Suillus cothurnatus]|nr:hypothetical protein BD769DRAFT_1386687 [Suillus cothurnatus]